MHPLVNHPELSETTNTREYTQKILSAAAYVKKCLGSHPIPDVALVLGSGLGGFSKALIEPLVIPYDDIPHMVKTTVAGHAGTLVIGSTTKGKQVLCFAGRVHAYEGIAMFEVTFLARLSHALGCKIFIATNAAGGAVDGMMPGETIAIADHINLLKRNPLHEVFMDKCLCTSVINTNEIYSRRIIELAKEIAPKIPNFHLREGVYASCSGPSYETPLEVRSGKSHGISAFGMSTVPECLVAKSLGMEVFALSLCTNLAAGISSTALSHEEVTECAKEAGPRLMAFMETLIDHLHAEENHNTVHLPEPDDRFFVLNREATRRNRSQIEEAVEFIKSKSNNNQYSIAIVMNSITTNWKEQVESPVEFSFTEIPHYPVLAGQGGSLVLGNFAQKSAICFVPKSEMGISPSEANFFTSILSILGVTQLIFSCVTASFDNEIPIGTILSLKDGFDFSTIHPYPEEFPVSQYCTELSVFAENNALDLPVGSFVQFVGPSYPTPAEISYVSESGGNLLGISSLSIAYSCRAAGIVVYGFAAVIYQLPSFSFTDSLRNETLVEMNQKIISFLQSEQQQSISAIVRPSVTIPPTQIDYENVKPYQANKEDVQALIELIRGVNAKVALVVLEPFFSYVEQLLDNLQPLSITTNEPAAPIYAASLNNNPIIVVRQNLFYNQGYTLSQVVASVKAAAGSGIEKLIFFAPFASNSEDLKVGQLVYIQDHLNISCRNPLYGEQIEGWGPRFPDMSTVWMTERISQEFQGVNVAVVIGPLFCSPLEAQFLNRVGLCEASSTGIGFEAIAAKHMNHELMLFGIGVVSNHVGLQATEQFHLDSPTLTVIQNQLTQITK